MEKQVVVACFSGQVCLPWSDSRTWARLSRLGALYFYDTRGCLCFVLFVLGWFVGFFLISSAFFCSLNTPCVPSAPFLGLLIYLLIYLYKKSIGQACLMLYCSIFFFDR